MNKMLFFSIMIVIIGLILMIVIDNIAMKIVLAVVVAIAILFNTADFYKFLPSSIVETSTFSDANFKEKVSEEYSSQEDILLTEDASKEDDLEEEWTQGTCIGDVPLEEEVSYEVWEEDMSEETFEEDTEEDFIFPTEELLRGMWVTGDDINTMMLGFKDDVMLITIKYSDDTIVTSGNYEIEENKIIFTYLAYVSGERSLDLQGQNKKENYYAKFSKDGKILYFSREDESNYIPFIYLGESITSENETH